MTITFKKIHPTFMAEVSPIDLREVSDEATLEQLRQGMTEYGVLVFKGQQFSHQDQLEPRQFRRRRPFVELQHDPRH